MNSYFYLFNGSNDINLVAYAVSYRPRVASVGNVNTVVLNRHFTKKFQIQTLYFLITLFM